MIVMTFLAAAIIGCLAGAMIFMMPSTDDGKEEKAQGVIGKITDNWEDEVSDENKDQSSRSGTKIPGYSLATMNEGDMFLKIRIGNPKENTVGLIATVRLEDGTELYKSPMLNPGQGLEEIPLEKTLSKGTYNAEVYYQCVLLNDEQTPLNSAISAFKLYVN